MHATDMTQRPKSRTAAGEGSPTRWRAGMLRLLLGLVIVLLSLRGLAATATEQAILEQDWRKQDGIGTVRAPASYATAIQQMLDRGDRLIADLEGNSVALADRAARWRQLREEYHSLSGVRGTDDAAWEDLWRRTHRLRREIVFANPLAATGPLLFVKQVPSTFSHQLTQYYGSCARPGGGVYVLDAPGQSLACRQLATDRLPPGSYQHPEVSVDGQHVLFAYCHAETTPADRESSLDRFYHLYEMAADGSGLRQLTEGPFDDFAPRYLPNGQIIFVSTRRGGFHRCGRGPCPTYTLAVAEADGSNPHPISFHETHEWDPVVLEDGRILYTRWDYVDRHAVFYEQLWTTRPDGTGVAAYYGNNTFNPIGVWEARPVPGSSRVMATAAAHHAMTAGSIILLDITKGRDGLTPITRLTPDALFPESEVPVANRSNPAAWSARLEGNPPRLPPEAVRWPGHCYRTPFPLSEKYFLAAYSFDALIGEPDPNSTNMFGIYLVDCFGNKELLHRDPAICSLWPVPLRSRARPAMLASLLPPEAVSEGTFLLRNVYESWPPLPCGSVKRLRVVQVLPKTTWHINDPPVGLANASPGKQVLGTVPVEADGSAYFRAPAKVALAFQALDELGQAVQTMRSLTYLQPGETASCIGCHESRHSAPPPQDTPLASRRAPSQIEPGPEGSHPLSYPLLVQPVLDRHCVHCHNSSRPDGGVLLTGEPQGHFTVSYNALVQRVPHSAWGGKPGDFRVVNSEPLTAPGFFGARSSSLMTLLRRGHEDVSLSGDDFQRLATWMDANALFYGTFDPADQARQLRGETIPGPALE
jgi:Hydrazine synthase alpha subunit middle domain/WD40-like Beta Propeller Repeat